MKLVWNITYWNYIRFLKLNSCFNIVWEKLLFSINVRHATTFFLKVEPRHCQGPVKTSHFIVGQASFLFKVRNLALINNWLMPDFLYKRLLDVCTLSRSTTIEMKISFFYNIILGEVSNRFLLTRNMTWLINLRWQFTLIHTQLVTYWNFQKSELFSMVFLWKTIILSQNLVVSSELLPLIYLKFQALKQNDNIVQFTKNEFHYSMISTLIYSRNLLEILLLILNISGHWMTSISFKIKSSKFPFT